MRQQARTARRNIPRKSFFPKFSFQYPVFLDKIGENPFLYQVLGILILTVAIVLTFQTSFDLSSAKTYADSLKSDTEVRMLTNFNLQNNESGSLAQKIEEIPPAKPEQSDIQQDNNEKPVEAVKQISYVVKSGDTLSGIANKVKKSVEEIVNVNNLEDAGKLTVGQTLIIPQ
jgi:LysM repeat protein